MNGWTLDTSGSGWHRAWTRMALGVAVCLVATGSSLSGQEVGANPEAGADQQRPELTEQQRQRLEELEQRFIERVSEALELSEEQTVQLRETLRTGRQERADVLRSRMALRRELNRAIAETDPDQARIQQLLDQRSALDRRQAEVGQNEERRLGEFMSPVQKARFMYLRQRMAQALRDRAAQARQRPDQRPRRPSGVDRPRTEQARDRAPRTDARIPTPRAPTDGGVRTAP